jgi:hypothetical protein
MAKEATKIRKTVMMRMALTFNAFERPGGTGKSGLS